jgi:diguanylate cyclase (GGDEF)-like protein
MQAELRAMDLLCRYGGEEFCAILPETNNAGAMRAGERLRAAVERGKFAYESVELALTISIGGASWSDAAVKEVPDLLAQADESLLEAKRSGRNAVRVAPEPKPAELSS